MGKPLNTVADIANRLGVQPKAIYYHIQRGNLIMDNDETIQAFITKYTAGAYKAGRPLKYQKGMVKTMDLKQFLTDTFNATSRSAFKPWNIAEAKAARAEWSDADDRILRFTAQEICDTMQEILNEYDTLNK